VGTIHLEVAVERPPDVVWKYLADPRHDVDWQEDVIHSTDRPTGPIQVGTRTFKVRGTRFGNQLTEAEITHVDHVAREWRELIIVGILRGSTGHYRVVPYGQGSRVVIDLDTRAPGPRKFVMAQVDRSTRSALASDLATLKRILEGAQPGARAG
jgi:polyketide cyclase/dehydrase/lipid transport protein